VSEHFPSQLDQFWCRECQRKTQHRFDNGVKGECVECMLKHRRFTSKGGYIAIDGKQLILEGDQENNERLAAAVTSYGVGTRSYNRSAEKRELDRQRAELTAKIESGVIKFESYDVPLMCSCPQRDYPHELSIHAQLKSESYNPKLRTQWPWSLLLSRREEPSTERQANGVA
jgi:hypothetical protein